MAGNSSVRGDETVTFTDNMSFDGTDRGGKMTTDGQLFIGSTASNRENNGGHVRLGEIISTDGSIAVGYSAPNITLETGGAVLTSVPTDDGTATPASGALKVVGSSSSDYVQSGIVTHSNGTSDEIYIENRLFGTKFVVDPSATIGERGSYQTITAATAAATAGDVVFIRAGTYVEDFVAKPDVFYIGVDILSVTIVGKVSINQTGTFSFEDIGFQTNGDYALEFTELNSPRVIFRSCDFIATNHTLLNLSSGFGACDFESCYFDITTTGITLFDTAISGFSVKWTYSIISNSGNSPTVSVNQMSEFVFNWSACLVPLRSVTNGRFNIANSILNTFALGITSLDIQGTGSNEDLNNVTITSGTAPCVNVAAGCTIEALNCVMDTDGPNLVTGGGTFRYAGISNAGSVQNAVIGATNSIPLQWLPYAQPAASAAASFRGTSSFNSAHFSVSNGFVSLLGGGTAVDSFSMQSGITPVVPNTSGIVFFDGGAVTAGTSPVRTFGASTNQMNVQVQLSQALSASQQNAVGLCNFNSANFSCDSNGFVSLNTPSPTVQTFTTGTGATYTTPANCKWIRIRLVGGGGGGCGSGTGGAAGGDGTATTFSGGNLQGSPGTSNPNTEAVGGDASGGNVANMRGSDGFPRSSNEPSVFGGNGGSSYFGGGGSGGDNGGNVGRPASPNSGSGGGGGGCNITPFAGNGGSAGGYVEHIIGSPAPSYSYTVGTGGAGGAAGTDGAAGGEGAAGIIIVEEHYV